mmetsp:Transcript_8841/g.21888  ORF Transcript_8841/g.21888 Transcript_8841/m.21888 type:complete len:370 (+) Transcript_8841:56-1165(+)
MTVFKRSVLQNNGDVDTAKFELVEVELTPPPPGHIQVKISKAGCAFADTAIRMGQYPGAAKPKMTLGYDLVGTVTALGEGVSGFAEGDRVVALTMWGAHQQYVNIPSEKPGTSLDGFTPLGGPGRIAKVPASCAAIPDEKIVAMVLNYVTAYQMLFRVAKLSKESTDQVVLVHGAAGGVGTAVLDLAKVYGIRVIGTASRAKHNFVRKLGGEPVDYRDQDWEPEVHKLVNNQGVNVVLDPVGGSNLNKSWRVLKSDGSMICFGGSSMHPREKGKLGGLFTFVWTLLTSKIFSWFSRQSFTFYIIMDMNDANKGAGSDWEKDTAALFELAAAKKIDPVIDSVVPLSDVQAALARLDNKDTKGKIIIDCTK